MYDKICVGSAKSFTLKFTFNTNSLLHFGADHEQSVLGMGKTELELRAGSYAIDFTQLGHQKCYGTK